MLIYFAWLTLMSAIQILLIVFLWINSGRLKNSLTEFHNFLVSYRQTPRSRIFKKHLPAGTMEPIMEADSFLEHSV
jgi:sRNA-binding regulator protein Hfq